MIGVVRPKNTTFISCKENFEEAIRLATGEFIFLSDQMTFGFPEELKNVWLSSKMDLT